ncbi:MAG: 23S rRNA (adenine(2503)-C(2))-methyltransferase RlmN [Kiritimatiellia bacterium]
MSNASRQPSCEQTRRPLAWGLSLAEWSRAVADLGMPAFRARQIWHGLQERLIGSWDELTTLPADLRRALAERYDVPALALSQVRESPDGVRKLLSACRDGELIESVLIPAEDRWTLCISSQAGCAFACAFCASGKAGLARNLAAGEIVGQVLLATRWLREQARPAPEAGAGASARHGSSRLPLLRPQNIVVMGMGEPLANYDEVLQALRILNAPEGLNIGARHITISTCGVVPGIQQLAGEGLQFELSVSLHAPNDALRTRLMPVNKRWPLAELLSACHDYTDTTNRIITFEYTLVRGINDQPEHARELITLLRGWKCHVNLIPLSPVAEFAGEAPDAHDCEGFLNALESARIATTLRRSRGRQADAACGQLRLRAQGKSAPSAPAG